MGTFPRQARCHPAHSPSSRSVLLHWSAYPDQGCNDGKSYNLTMTIAVTSALRFRAQNAGSTAYTSFEQNALIFSLPSLTVAPRAGRRYRRVHCWFCVCSCSRAHVRNHLSFKKSLSLDSAPQIWFLGHSFPIRSIWGTDIATYVHSSYYIQYTWRTVAAETLTGCDITAVITLFSRKFYLSGLF